MRTRSPSLNLAGPALPLPLDGAPDRADAESESLAEFLGQEPDAGYREAAGAAPACRHCGCTWAAFRQTNRLGCAHCYAVFAAQLLPMLAGFHRHPSHMGKAPGFRDGCSTKLVEMTKARIALERAIAAENFEEAARLRDLMRGLQDRPDKGRNDAWGDPEGGRP